MHRWVRVHVLVSVYVYVYVYAHVCLYVYVCRLYGRWSAAAHALAGRLRHIRLEQPSFVQFARLSCLHLRKDTPSSPIKSSNRPSNIVDRRTAEVPQPAITLCSVLRGLMKKRTVVQTGLVLESASGRSANLLEGLLQVGELLRLRHLPYTKHLQQSKLGPLPTSGVSAGVRIS